MIYDYDLFYYSSIFRYNNSTYTMSHTIVHENVIQSKAVKSVYAGAIASFLTQPF